jgi:uncharacterized protein YeaO (DUF488 family)
VATGEPRARLDEWARELGPSDELHTWYAHVAERFAEFARRYRGELAAQRSQLRALRRRSRQGTLTIAFAARDPAHSNAAVPAGALRRGVR